MGRAGEGRHQPQGSMGCNTRGMYPTEIYVLIAGGDEQQKHANLFRAPSVRHILDFYLYLIMKGLISEKEPHKIPHCRLWFKAFFTTEWQKAKGNARFDGCMGAESTGIGGGGVSSLISLSSLRQSSVGGGEKSVTFSFQAQGNYRIMSVCRHKETRNSWSVFHAAPSSTAPLMSSIL